MNPTEQQANNTRYDRYPEIFAVARRSAALPKRVLSFGCSTGEEVQTLAEKYFPDAQIVGVDVAPAVLERAKALTSALANVTICASDAAAILSHAPYDIIFAMSVLCRNPAPRNWAEFSFERFEARISEFLEWLLPGGIFVLVNANYNLTQSRLIRFFDLIVSPDLEGPGQVWKLAPNRGVLERPGGGILKNKAATDCVFRRREEPWPDAKDIPLRIATPENADLATIWLNFPEKKNPRTVSRPGKESKS